MENSEIIPLFVLNNGKKHKVSFNQKEEFMKKFALVCIAAMALSACCNSKKCDSTANCADSTAVDSASIVSIIGTWVQPIPGQAGEQGITLTDGGAASSVNMATLVYKNWKQNGDTTLTLISESVGNGKTLTDTMTFEIVKLDKDSLVIKKGELVETYARKK